MNRFHIKPGQEGLYRVQKGRALHWPSNDGKPVIWARPSQYVDLRSPFLCELVQRTGQLHKLDQVDAVPADASLVRETDAPAAVREAMQLFEAGSPHSVPGKAPVGHAEQKRSIDLTQLPSAKVEAPADLKYKPADEKGSRKPRSSRSGKEE
tara:strand:- start:9203 stop:9658 length:456 start_codon:yes stop_codon:yes gene_type:complete